MKKYILLLLVLFITNVVFAVKVVDLPGLLQPDFLYVDGDDFILIERSTHSIHVYSLKTLELKYKLGSKGEGPAEFKQPPTIQAVTPDYILACDWTKGIWFSREGKLIKEETFPSSGLREITPIKENYVAEDMIRNPQSADIGIAAVLVNSKFKKIKELARCEKVFRIQFAHQTIESRKFDLFVYHVSYKVYDDKIFWANGQKGFYFDVFDRQGNLLYSIDKNDQVEKIKVDNAYKEKALDYVKVYNRILYESHLRGNFLFLDYFPAFRGFRIDDKKIYVFTYKEKNDTREMIVLDLKGEILDRLFVPLHLKTYIPRIAGDDPFTVYKGALYELAENEETEIWELHKTDFSTITKK
jgi:hypothetical protein